MLAGYFIRNRPFIQQFIREMQELHDPPVIEEALKSETGAGLEEDNNERVFSQNASSENWRGFNYLVYMVYSMLFAFLLAQSPNIAQESQVVGPAPVDHELLIGDILDGEPSLSQPADSLPSDPDDPEQADTDPKAKETSEEMAKRLVEKYKHLIPALSEGEE